MIAIMSEITLMPPQAHTFRKLAYPLNKWNVTIFKRMLVRQDGSVRAEQALLNAVRLACTSGSSILLQQVVGPHVCFEAPLVA
jgi:hypothetical protein